MRLYIRDRSKWITFIHTLEELKALEVNFIPGTVLCIGDVSQFTPQMRTLLLKFLEDNPSIDCFSSKDLGDPILVSRFTQVIKEPYNFEVYSSEEDYWASDKTYSDVRSCFQTTTAERQLFIADSSKQMVNIISSL